MLLTLRAAQSESDVDHMAHNLSQSSHVVSPASFYREASLTNTNGQESARAHTHTRVCVFSKKHNFPLFSGFFFFFLE